MRGMWLPIPFPRGLRYLLCVIHPSTVREMRTLALALDLIFHGKVGSVGDLVIQRLRALCMIRAILGAASG